MVIRIHGHDTGGVVSAVESHDVPGGGPPPHIHSREDETFQVQKARYEFTVDGKSFVAKHGATIFAPRGVPAHLPLPRPDPPWVAHVCHYTGQFRGVL